MEDQQQEWINYVLVCRLEDILNGSVKGNQRNLDIGPHPVYIESGPPSKDKVRCRIKSIQPLGSRQHNKDSPIGKKTELS
ncbi:hypothetical protein YC2023_041068 [Brassica napus]